jgi:hypothetical protein
VETIVASIFGAAAVNLSRNGGKTGAPDRVHPALRTPRARD